MLCLIIALVGRHIFMDWAFVREISWLSWMQISPITLVLFPSQPFIPNPRIAKVYSPIYSVRSQVRLDSRVLITWQTTEGTQSWHCDWDPVSGHVDTLFGWCNTWWRAWLGFTTQVGVERGKLFSWYGVESGSQWSNRQFPVRVKWLLLPSTEAEDI